MSYNDPKCSSPTGAASPEPGQEAVEDVIRALYAELGVTPLASWIERVAMVAVEAARPGLRREWEEEHKSGEGS